MSSISEAKNRMMECERKGKLLLWYYKTPLKSLCVVVPMADMKGGPFLINEL